MRDCCRIIGANTSWTMAYVNIYIYMFITILRTKDWNIDAWYARVAAWQRNVPFQGDVHHGTGHLPRLVWIAPERVAIPMVNVHLKKKATMPLDENLAWERWTPLKNQWKNTVENTIEPPQLSPVPFTDQVTFGLCIPRGKCKDFAVQWLLVPLLMVYLRRGGPDFVNHEVPWQPWTSNITDIKHKTNPIFYIYIYIIYVHTSYVYRCVEPKLAMTKCREALRHELQPCVVTISTDMIRYVDCSSNSRINCILELQYSSTPHI